jgi:hypothetical protein
VTTHEHYLVWKNEKKKEKTFSLSGWNVWLDNACAIAQHMMVINDLKPSAVLAHLGFLWCDVLNYFSEAVSRTKTWK